MADRTYIPFWVLPLNLALALSVILLMVSVWFSRTELPREQLLALRLVHKQVVEEHVKPPSAEDLMWSAIEGMVSSLDDDYSEFVRPSAVPRFVETEPPPTPKLPLFADVPAESLLGYGVPAEWLDDVRQATEDTLFDLAEHLPNEAAEALLDLATGGTPAPAVAVAAETDPFEHPAA